MSTLKELVLSAEKRLKDSDSARLDAELLLARTMSRDRAWIFTWPEHMPNAEQISEFESLLARRIKGEPVAYILGQREFWGLEFECNEHTLIPRPETELLVETALSLELPVDAQVLDLGTGTGAIALALASEKPDWNITAVERISEALALAKRNASRLGILSIDWFEGSWFNPLAGDQKFDLIISNPPYVESGSRYLEKGDIRYEPRSALISGSDGMDDIRHIVSGARTHLVDPGYLLLEHGCEQANLIARELARESYRSITGLKDLSGLDRATISLL